jgi:hypothetical protein
MKPDLSSGLDSSRSNTLTSDSLPSEMGVKVVMWSQVAQGGQLNVRHRGLADADFLGHRCRHGRSKELAGAPDALYPIVYLDCIHAKERDSGTVRVKAVYLALGVGGAATSNHQS